MAQAPPSGIWHRLARWYTRGMMAFGCTLLGAIVVIMGVQVFFRYVLDNSIIWAEEMSRYLLVWITFLFLGIAYQRGELIALSLVLRRVSRPLQVVFTVFAYGASILMLVVLVWYGFKFAEVNAIQTLPAFDFIWAQVSGNEEEINVSSWWLYASVPVGAALLALHLAVGLVVRIRRLLAGDRVFDEDELEQEPVGTGTR